MNDRRSDTRSTKCKPVEMGGISGRAVVACELHSFRLKCLGGSEHVVAPERDRPKLPNAFLMTFRREQANAGLGAREEQLNPSLLLGKRLVRGDLQPECLGVELQGCSDDSEAISQPRLRPQLPMS
jgi:hypothetical protein